MRRRALIGLLAAALAVLGTADAWSAARDKHSSPHRKKAVAAERQKHSSKKSAIEATRPLSPELAAVKQAIELARRHKTKEATSLAAASGDPVVAKLVEWVSLRQSGSEAGFDRYVSFIRANPDWPSMSLLRRRAEAKLWQERRDSATVRQFIGEAPSSSIGRLALARIKLAEGDRTDAESDVRAVWRSAELSADLETALLAAFPNVLTPRRPSGAHGSAHRRQGFWRCGARRKTGGPRSSCDRQGLRRGRGKIPQREGTARRARGGA